MKIIFFLFLFSFLAFFNLVKADPTKIYDKGYKNPLNVLNSFLWNEKKGKIGLISKVNIQNRDLEATIHPVALNSSKIKIALSKIKYTDEEKQFTDFLFNEENLEALSKYTSKGLLLANKNQDVIFQFINKKKKEKNVTQGIIFAQKNSLNLVFFQIHGCGYDKLKNKRIKKKEFYKNHPNFSFVKKKNCHKEKKRISVTSTKGIYKKSTNENYSWIIFTSASWKTNTIN